MYGEGLNGKGSLQEFLLKHLGEAYGSYDPDPRMHSRFVASTFIGKRLLMVSECNETNLVQSSLFKALMEMQPYAFLA
jgi:phage/plasmid-associated DNA primase